MFNCHFLGFKLAKRAYLALRPFAQLFAALLQVGSGGAGCAKLAQQPMAAVAGVQERLRVEEFGAGKKRRVFEKEEKVSMKHDISWRIMMIYDDFMENYDDLWWFMMIYDDLWEYI